ncbi:glycoside hydrolase superfamily [Ilyonectria robusta]|uniref:glycoside hydrolase superfamily n=1 Tax=Ilyonectria robusta TaxID=1079257 RepID=UPI001E8CAB52|nr:glycoside hydrolase superfamily [Ilyonectria robusta]KAH8673028.1 glycoside hydrolase superfamily [Ilyonectria robusta]
MRLLYLSPALLGSVSALSLSLAPSGGNQSSQLLYGLLYEDIYHSGDGGLYGEMIRNRAFQGSAVARRVSLDPTTDFWHPVGNVELSIADTTPLSSSLPHHLQIKVPAGAKGPVGFYNDGFWGFNVDAAKRYIASLYIRADYTGKIDTSFRNTISGQTLSSSAIKVNQKSSDGWVQVWTPTFMPDKSPGNPNNTFYFTFDGEKLAGKTIDVNLISLFKQTFLDRSNGLRQDLAESVEELGHSWIRLPGGNNMQGLRRPLHWTWNQTIGALKDRSGQIGVWGDINTNGFGLLEQMQMARDLNLTVVLGVHAGLYLNGDVVAPSDMQPYVDMALNELEFLNASHSPTPYGALRSSLGYPKPFNVQWVEIGNEDYLNGGTKSYYDYRFNTLYKALKQKYPDMHFVATINPSPSPDKGKGGMIDLHIYDSQDHFASLYNTFDQASRDFPVFVAEYAAIRALGNGGPEIGAQTFGMSCAEAIFLLGIERNSDIILGSAYGALIKQYDEEPNTVAVIKHTANDILRSMTYHVQKLFAHNMGTETLPVKASDGGIGPVYWSATKRSDATILKLVNYNGQTGSQNAVQVVIEDSDATQATLTVLSAESDQSVNNLRALGGEASKLATTTVKGNKGKFSVVFDKPYEIAILEVSNRA